NAHHRIPVEAIEKCPIVQEAIKQGFDFNGILNGSWVRRYSSVKRVNPKTGKVIASPDGIHASHDAYNDFLIEEINRLSKGMAKENAKVFLESYAQKLGKKIDDLHAVNEKLLSQGKDPIKLNDLFTVNLEAILK
nr:hypothetical protein [Cytophagaceae bacterium]